jgi:hypothetical protein
MANAARASMDLPRKHIDQSPFIPKLTQLDSSHGSDIFRTRVSLVAHSQGPHD